MPASPHKQAEKRCLSIQSFVSVGYVGNKAAVPVLQLLGIETDVVNTVEFSNHTGYKQWGGSKMSVDHLRSIFDAFDKNGFAGQSHLLTGYIGNAEALELVLETVDNLKAANKDLIYLCDPVMGDDGAMYVPQACLPLYKQLLPKATVITPNDYEVELLTDVKIDSLAKLREALNLLHERYSLPHAIVSSCTLPRADLQELGVAEKRPLLVCAGSSLVEGKPKAFIIVFSALDEYFQGVGDVFSALCLAHFGCDREDAPTSLARTAELAIASLSGIIGRTRAHALQLADGDASQLQPASKDEDLAVRAKRLQQLELRLVQSQSDILHPQVRHRAVTI